jgi:hypothetical protein
MIQPEPLGLLPSVVVVPQDSLHYVPRILLRSIYSHRSQVGCLSVMCRQGKQLKLGLRPSECLQLPLELLTEHCAVLPGPTLRSAHLGSLACQVFHEGGMMCCLPFAECAVRLSQRALRPHKHPSHQLLDLVEVPSSRLSFSCSCSLDPLYFREQPFAMALNRLDTIPFERPAQPLSEALDAQAQLGTGSPHLVAFGPLLLVSSIRGSRYLLTLAPASGCPLFPGCPLLLLRSSTARRSAGSLSL